MSIKLFVAGIPGTGKTCFGNALRDEFGFMHIDLESELQRLLIGEYENDLRRFMEEMSQCSQCFIATWGFPVHCLPIVEQLRDSDVRLVWFDGHRELARKAWLRAKGTSDDADFQKQIRAIDSCMGKIKSLFSKGWIETFSAEGNPLSCEQILDRLSIQGLRRRPQ